MQIDDYAEASALSNKLEAAIPFKVRPKKELVKLLHEQGKRVSLDDELEVTLVKYSGDMGGIICGVGRNEQDKEAIITSLTHLKFDPAHPLADDVRAYQQNRIRGLKLQDRRSFMTEISRLDQSPTSKKKKRDRGFGK
jgi:hypothetical protein